ncbi:MAG: HAD family hydrolase [bacterium]|nr:HAD family hydrolase [bacterium]
MILAVISDLDGTLIDSLTEGIQSVQHVAHVLEWRVPHRDEVRRQWGRPLRLMLEHLWPGQNHAKFLETRDTLAHESDARHPVYPGVFETLQRLRQQGKIVGLHTNRTWAHDALKTRLQISGFGTDAFAFIHTPENGVPPKPDPRSLLALLSYLERQHRVRKRNEVCFVSDHPDDADMALIKCGVRFAGVLTGAATRDDFALHGVPDSSIVPSIAELPELLDTW